MLKLAQEPPQLPEIESLEHFRELQKLGWFTNFIWKVVPGTNYAVWALEAVSDSKDLNVGTIQDLLKTINKEVEYAHTWNTYGPELFEDLEKAREAARGEG